MDKNYVCGINMVKEKTFIKVTNRMLYDTMKDHHKESQKRFNDIEMHAVKTNGKVKNNKWIATTALTFIIAIVLYIVQGGIS